MSINSVPGGSKQTKMIFLVGGAAAVGIFLYERKKSKAAAAATAAAAAVPVAADPNIDPNTGLPYAGTGTDSSGGGYSSAYGTTPSYYGSGGGYTAIGNSTPASPQSNPAWVQAAETYLVSQGFDSTAVAGALGYYIAGNGLSNDQLSIVQAAIAAEGYPPVAVPAPHVSAPSGQGGGTVGNPTTKQNGLHRIGTVGQVYPWSTEAARYHTTVAMLERLNPNLSPAHPIPGGYALTTPPGT